MKTLSITAVLVLLLAAARAQVNVVHPVCDSPEAEEAALLARDYLNGQHTHGYKYELNRIEDIKIFPGLNGDDVYVLEVDLLETDCHVLDPTPVANCTVRPKLLTAVEGDCDVVLKKVAGVLTVTAFKCKTEESTEDLCVGCFTLLPLNDTAALDFVQTSLATFNNNTGNVSYAILEVGRMSSQVVSGGHQYLAEYVVIEANCTGDVCVATSDPSAERGICTARGFKGSHTLQCKMFHIPMVPVVDANSTVAAVPPPSVHVHTSSMSRKHGLRHHKLTSLHNPHLSGHLSAESAESAEVVPVAPAVAADLALAVGGGDEDDVAADVAADSASDSSGSKEDRRFKRDAPATPNITLTHFVISQTGPALFRPRCPGMIRYFD